MQNRFSRSNFSQTGAHHRRLTWCLTLLLVGHLAACLDPCQAQGIPEVEADSEEGHGAPVEGAGGYEIEIRFVNGNGDEPLIQPNSGWPLTLSLTANEEKLLGIGHTGWPEDAYPDASSTGYIVFEDVDGCPSWVDVDYQKAHIRSLKEEGWARYERCLQPPPPPWPKDDVWIEISPGLNLRDPKTCGDRPQLLTWARSRINPEKGYNSEPTSIGPCVGSENDGYGYGRSQRLPGLVLLADAGPGVVTDEGFERLPRARNLAGFFDSVAYELKDARSRTSILVHMNVPEGLFSPVALVDDCTKGRRGREVRIRVDGAPEECVDDWGSREVTIRAFMVNQQAPDSLTDANDDGIVDIDDAERAGLRLLSGQAVYWLWRLPRQLSKDLDGDGDAMEEGDGPPPADPGTLTDPPR